MPFSTNSALLSKRVRSLSIEPLEPRNLLSADALGLAKEALLAKLLSIRERADDQDFTEIVGSGGDFAATNGVPNWTFLIYMDGDNNLEEYYNYALDQMEASADNPNVNLVVQYDRRDGYDSTHGDWTDTRRFWVQYDTDYDNFYAYTEGVNTWDLGELDMGDPDTLTDFITWGTTQPQFAADNYALIIKDHGAGWLGLVYDDTNESYLSLSDLGGALSAAGVSFGLTFFDVCMESMTETVNEVADWTSYVVGFESSGWTGTGVTDYTSYISDVTATITPEELAQAFVTDYVAAYGGLVPYYTASAIDTGEFSSFVSDLDAFAQSMVNNMQYQAAYRTAVTATQTFETDIPYSSYRDLYDFVEEVLDRVPTSATDVIDAGNAALSHFPDMIVAEAHSDDFPDAHGLSIYLPENNSDYGYFSLYQMEDFSFIPDYNWDEFLVELYAPLGGGNSDLVGSYLNVAPDNIADGTAEISWQVSNIGSGSAGPSYVSFYLVDELDETPTTDDLIGSEWVGPLGAGTDTDIRTSELTIPDDIFNTLVPGEDYYIMMVVDSGHQVTETDETNNSWQGFLVDYDDVGLYPGDSTPPTVQNFTASETGAVITFSEPMNADAVDNGDDIWVEDGYGSYVPGSISWSPDNTVLTWTPDSGTLSTGNYMINLLGRDDLTFTDTAGYVLDGDADGSEGGNYEHPWMIDAEGNLGPWLVWSGTVNGLKFSIYDGNPSNGIGEYTIATSSSAYQRGLTDVLIAGGSAAGIINKIQFSDNCDDLGIVIEGSGLIKNIRDTRDNDSGPLSFIVSQVPIGNIKINTSVEGALLNSLILGDPTTAEALAPQHFASAGASGSIKEVLLAKLSEWVDSHSGKQGSGNTSATLYSQVAGIAGASGEQSADEVPTLVLNGFEDVTDSVGLTGMSNFQAAWGDYNNDGWVDLYTSGELWRNDGGTHFTRVEGTTFSGPGIWGDFDNDGYLDLFTWTGTGHLYRNVNGTGFEDVSDIFPDLPGGGWWSLGATWGDFNGDGYIDLYIGGYENGYHPDFIYINNGGTSFTRVWQTPSGQEDPARGITACDFDQDGDIDIYVSNYRLEANLLWLNDGSGNFTNVAPEYGVAGDYDGWDWSYGHTIGSAWGDLDSDGDFDLFVGNFSHPPAYQDRPKFYENLGEAGGFHFSDRSASAGLAWQESYASPTLGDFDNDGDLDLFFTTYYPGDHSVLYSNNGNWTFSDVTGTSGIASEQTYQAAWADFDHDGNLDLVSDGKLFRNVGDSNNWLEVHLIGNGTSVNKAAIGAQVRIDLGDQVIARQVEGATGQGNQNDLTLHFGLGDHSSPVELEIVWPDGTTRSITATTNQIITVSQSIPGWKMDSDIDGDGETTDKLGIFIDSGLTNKLSIRGEISGDIVASSIKRVSLGNITSGADLVLSGNLSKMTFADALGDTSIIAQGTINSIHGGSFGAGLIEATSLKSLKLSGPLGADVDISNDLLGPLSIRTGGPLTGDIHSGGEIRKIDVRDSIIDSDIDALSINSLKVSGDIWESDIGVTGLLNKVNVGGDYHDSDIDAGLIGRIKVKGRIESDGFDPCHIYADTGTFKAQAENLAKVTVGTTPVHPLNDPLVTLQVI